MKLFRKLSFAALMVLPFSAIAAEAPAKLYKNPNCACCDEYAAYLEKNGFEVELVSTHDLMKIKEEKRIPQHLQGCHTMVAGPYVFEGLVPVETVKKVLEERPFIRGVALPGMPSGAPGMPGRKQGPLEVYSLSFRADAPTTVYATH
jgi:hypothetical protein